MGMEVEESGEMGYKLRREIFKQAAAG